MKTVYQRVAFVIVALCALVPSAAPTAAADSYKINVITSLTGGASFLGKGEQAALELLKKSVNKTGGINGRDIEFVYSDDQSSPQTAVQLATQIMASNPPVILGPSLVAMCNAAGALMKTGPVMYCLSPGIHPPAGSYIFTSSASTYDLAKALMRYYRMKGWSKGIVQAGLDVPTGTTDGNMTHAQMKNYAAFLPKQLYIPSALWPAYGHNLGIDPAVEKAQEAFYAEFKTAGIAPDLPASIGWNTGAIVTNGLRKLGPNVTATQLRDYIGSLSGYAGIDGIHDFVKSPQRGLDLNDALVTRWDPAKNNWMPLSKPGGAPIQ